MIYNHVHARYLLPPAPAEKKKTNVAFRATPRFPGIASTSAWQEPRRNTRCKRHWGIPQTETKKPVNLNILDI